MERLKTRAVQLAQEIIESPHIDKETIDRILEPVTQGMEGFEHQLFIELLLNSMRDTVYDPKSGGTNQYTQ